MAARKEPKPAPAVSAAEESALTALHGALDEERVAHVATRSRLEGQVEALHARITELEAELASAVARIRELDARLQARAR
ncbi:MAG TPA: hypothetical protein VGL86_01465 [Polyangia bacterium]|jgi:hypothetical protein